MSQGFAKAICIIQFSKEEISSIFVKISTLQGRFWPWEREVSLFFPFSFLAKVNDVLQSEQRKEPKEIYLFLDGDAPLPPSPFILPSATFFTPNYFPRERENAVHFSPLITFFFFFFFSLVVTSCCFVASLHIQEATGIYAVRPWKHSFVRPEFSDLKLMDDGVESWTPLPLPTSVS